MELTLQVLSTGDKPTRGRGEKNRSVEDGEDEEEKSEWKQGEQNGGAWIEANILIC